MAGIEDRVRAGFEAYNARDWSTLASIYHPDLIWQFPGALIRGHDLVLARHRSEQTACPHHDEVRSVTVVGPVAHVEHTVHLTVHRRQIEWPMFALLHWHGDQLVHEQTFWGEIPDGVLWRW